MSRSICAALALATAAGTANANVLFTFGFTDLEGSYDAGSASFNAAAVAGGAFDTTGDVTRDGTNETAAFDTGFAGGPTLADMQVDLTVSGIAGNTATGTGMFTITDHDGDTITGDINGGFTSPDGASIFFNGLLSNVQLTDNGATDGRFHGPSGGSFDMDFAAPTMTGAVIQLFFSPSGFFNSDFSGVTVQFDGEVVPTPATATLLTLAGLTLTRRRR